MCPGPARPACRSAAGSPPPARRPAPPARPPPVRHPTTQPHGNPSRKRYGKPSGPRPPCLSADGRKSGPRRSDISRACTADRPPASRRCRRARGRSRARSVTRTPPASARISLTPFHSGSSGSSARIPSSIFSSSPGLRARAGRDERLVADLELLEVAEQAALGRVGLLARVRPALVEDRPQVAALPAAGPERLRAARVERAAQRRRRRVGHLAARQVARERLVGVGLRDRADQRLRVRVLGLVEDLLDGPDLDDPAEVHDRHAVAEELRAGQVVRDVDVRQPEPVLEVDHEVEDLRPHAHVEHRDGLVGDHQVGAEDDRPRDRGALLLAAGEVARAAGARTARPAPGRPARASRGPWPASRRRPWSACGSAAGARARSRASCPGSARRAGPGRPSAGAGAWAAAGARAARRAPRRAASRCRRSGARARAARGRASSCPSPTRRPGRAPRPRCRSKETPSTAFTEPPPRPVRRERNVPCRAKWTSRSRTSIRVLVLVSVALMLPPRRPAPRARAARPSRPGCPPSRAASTPSGAPGRR